MVESLHLHKTNMHLVALCVDNNKQVSSIKEKQMSLKKVLIEGFLTKKR